MITPDDIKQLHTLTEEQGFRLTLKIDIESKGGSARTHVMAYVERNDITTLHSGLFDGIATRDNLEHIIDGATEAWECRIAALQKRFSGGAA